MTKKKTNTIEQETEKDKKFFEYQRDYYQVLKKFIVRGDDFQKSLKKTGAIAPTEVLMFLLFWNMLKAKFDDAQLDFICMTFSKIMVEDWFRGRMIDPPTDDLDMEFGFDKPKKETLH